MFYISVVTHASYGQPRLHQRALLVLGVLMIHGVLLWMFSYGGNSRHYSLQKVSTVQVRLLQSELPHKTNASALLEREASVRSYLKTSHTSENRISNALVTSIKPKIMSDVQSAKDAAATSEVGNEILLNSALFVAKPKRNGPLTSSFEPVNQSLRELSQAKLGRAQPTDALAQGIAGAGIADCLRPAGGRDSNDSSLLDLPSLIYDALRGKCQ